MLRIIVDKLGSGQKDLFLQIDSFPNFSKTGDSYYLPAFFDLTQAYLDEQGIGEQYVLRYAIEKLVSFWNSSIDAGKGGIFLPFDLQDEYIGGLLLKATTEGFRTKYVFSDRIHGYEVNQEVITSLIEERKIEFRKEEQVEWLISYQQFQNGLNWTLKELEK